jgi:hypothetical protein
MRRRNLRVQLLRLVALEHQLLQPAERRVAAQREPVPLVQEQLVQEQQVALQQQALREQLLVRSLLLVRLSQAQV